MVTNLIISGQIGLYSLPLDLLAMHDCAARTRTRCAAATCAARTVVASHNLIALRVSRLHYDRCCSRGVLLPATALCITRHACAAAYCYLTPLATRRALGTVAIVLCADSFHRVAVAFSLAPAQYDAPFSRVSCNAALNHRNLRLRHGGTDVAAASTPQTLTPSPRHTCCLLRFTCSSSILFMLTLPSATSVATLSPPHHDAWRLFAHYIASTCGTLTTTFPPYLPTPFCPSLFPTPNTALPDGSVLAISW